MSAAEVEEVEVVIGVDPHGAVLLFLWLPDHSVDVLFLLVLVGEGILDGGLGLLSLLGVGDVHHADDKDVRKGILRGRGDASASW
jgi:hypothetical protein